MILFQKKTRNYPFNNQIKPMKKYIYLLTISLSLTNCYTYKVKAESEEPKQGNTVTKLNQNEQIAVAAVTKDAKLEIAELKQETKTGKIKAVKPQPTTIEEKLEASKYYKIEASGRSYKIQVDQWESDTLVAHVIHKPKKILKFHKNQINQATIAERRFSQPVADILTVAAYAGIGVGIWALVR